MQGGVVIWDARGSTFRVEIRPRTVLFRPQHQVSPTLAGHSPTVPGIGKPAGTPNLSHRTSAKPGPPRGSNYLGAISADGPPSPLSHTPTRIPVRVTLQIFH